jgi:hypothetical protein
MHMVSISDVTNVEEVPQPGVSINDALSVCTKGAKSVRAPATPCTCVCLLLQYLLQRYLLQSCSRVGGGGTMKDMYYDTCLHNTEVR